MNIKLIAGLVTVLVISCCPVWGALQVGEIYNYNLGPGDEVPGLPLRGGEFIVHAADGDFRTFCLERNETVGNPMKVGSITTSAIHGGVGGGDPDPISTQTAYLFKRFALGDLSGYYYSAIDDGGLVFANRTAAATALQAAIWFFEEEYKNDTEKGFLEAAGQYFIDLADMKANGGLYGVQVVNNLKPSPDFNVAAQDFLQQVPEATTIAIWSTLLLIGAAAYRRSHVLLR